MCWYICLQGVGCIQDAMQFQQLLSSQRYEQYLTCMVYTGFWALPSSRPPAAASPVTSWAALGGAPAPEAAAP